MSDGAVTYDARSRTVHVSGEVVGSAAEDLHAALRDLLAGGGGAVDLSGVTYLPSAATGPLMITLRDSLRAGTPFTLVATEGSIASRVLQTMGVEHVREVGDPA